MAKVVIEHYHSKDEGVYRLVVADEVWHDVHVPADIDDEGVAPALEAKPTLVGHTNHEDFLFAADDARWKRKKPTEIAKLQRELVAAALTERVAASAAAEQPKHRRMPGVGEEL